MRLAEFEEEVERVVASVPSRFLEGIDQVRVLPGALVEDPRMPEVVTLGQYLREISGCFVVLHYGSFRSLRLGGRRAWRREVRQTVLHEILHHWEDRAGLTGLEDEDRDRLARWRRRYGKKEMRRRRREVWRDLASVVGVVAAVMALVALAAWLAP